MKLVITMSRRYGTGASMIAQELAQKLGIPVYDKAYIEHAAESGSEARNASEARGASEARNARDARDARDAGKAESGDKASYDYEVQVIKKLAENPCIILGRCASEILKDQPNVFNIYICADKKDRIARIMKKENLSFEDAKDMLEKNDRERAEYYFEHTGKVWGDVNNYNMILDTTALGAENCASILLKYFERMEYI